jgi:hypothetical protein
MRLLSKNTLRESILLSMRGYYYPSLEASFAKGNTKVLDVLNEKSLLAILDKNHLIQLHNGASQ